MVGTGLEIFMEGGDFAGKRYALIANQTSVTAGLAYGWEELRRRGMDLVRIFSPEHGLFAAEQDQVPVTGEPQVGPPVVSLYGSRYETLIPDPAHLDGLDCVLFDIQDVGTRYYTYVNTLILFMRRLSGTGIEIMVLDRPNPIGGIAVEGPLLAPGFENFCGVMPVAVRHGLTAGELALFARDHFTLDLPLRVVTMKGWQREMFFDQTGLPWVPPSPNMPDLETALLYPGMCLFEGLNVSEGRGSTTPFKLIGAPFVEPFAFARRMNSLNLPGILFRPVYFKPTFNKYRGETVGGVYLHVTDRRLVRPFDAAVAMVGELRSRHPETVFLSGVYEFNDIHPAFDLLAGSDKLRGALESGRSLDALRALWEDEEKEFMKLREPYLLYR